MSDDVYPVRAPGWAALDQVGQSFYSGQTPHQFTSTSGYDLNSTSPLPAVCVWEAGEPEHWHFVSYGLTELFEKSSHDPERSGFGFELTFRLPRDTEMPPAWAVALLQTLGHYVLAGQGGLDSGHLLNLGAPLLEQSLLCACVAVPDPLFGKVDTQFGSVLFLQLFGLTQAESDAMQSWSLERKVGLVRDVAPRGVTDPARKPFEHDRATVAAWRRHALGILL